MYLGDPKNWYVAAMWTFNVQARLMFWESACIPQSYTLALERGNRPCYIRERCLITPSVCLPDLAGAVQTMILVTYLQDFLLLADVDVGYKMSSLPSSATLFRSGDWSVMNAPS